MSCSDVFFKDLGCYVRTTESLVALAKTFQDVIPYCVKIHMRSCIRSPITSFANEIDTSRNIDYKLMNEGFGVLLNDYWLKSVGGKHNISCTGEATYKVTVFCTNNYCEK